MKPKQSIHLAICLLTVVCLNTGCQSGFLKKPDFGKLAFWKGTNLRLASNTDDIPPPSAHFSPDAGEGSQTKDELKAKMDEIIADARKTKTDSADPIRKPYSLDSIDPKLADREKAKPESNDFVLSDKIKQFQSTTNKALTATENTINKAAGAVESTANQFNGWKNTLQDSSKNQIKQVAQQLTNGANQAISQTSNSLNQFSKSAYDSINQTVSTVKNSIDNSFQPPAGSAVVKNPFSDQKPAASNAMAGNDFVMKDKTASKPQAGNSKAVENNFAKNQLVPNTIQQSSFNANIKKDVSSALQPKTSSQSAPTTYPSTGFEAFSPVQRSKSESSDVFKIPASLLRGDSSFSPGSTRPLRPSTTNN